MESPSPRVICGQPFTVFIDAADTPDKLSACLRSVRSLTSGRIICLAAADGHESVRQRQLTGSITSHLADLVVLTGNVLDVPEAAIADIEVDYTIVAGDIRYQR